MSAVPVWLRFLAIVLIWGSTWFAITLQAGPVPTSWSIVWRFSLAALVLLVIAKSQRIPIRLSKEQHGLVAVQGILQFCLNFQFAYHAVTLVPSGLMSITFATMVITNPLMAALLIRAPLRPAILVGGLLSVAGVILMFKPEIDHFSWHDKAARGLLLGMLAVFAVTLANLFPLLRRLRDVPVISMIFWSMAYGTLATMLAALLVDGPPVIELTPRYLLSLLFLALIGSSLAFSLYFSIIQTHGVTVAAYTGIFIPAVALVWSTFLEGYHWNRYAVAGALFALLGSWLALRKPASSVV
jgi:drug/metabolite transporter (DMT)-like permease